MDSQLFSFCVCKLHIFAFVIIINKDEYNNNNPCIVYILIYFHSAAERITGYVIFANAFSVIVLTPFVSVGTGLRVGSTVL